MEFKNKVKYVRTKLGISQQELADALGISFSTINRWENGRVVPSKLAMKSFSNFCLTYAIIVFDDDIKGGK